MYEQRGGEHGHDLDDWLRAEWELIARQTSSNCHALSKPSLDLAGMDSSSLLDAYNRLELARDPVEAQLHRLLRDRHELGAEMWDQQFNQPAMEELKRRRDHLDIEVQILQGQASMIRDQQADIFARLRAL